MNEAFHGEICIVAMRGTEAFAEQVEQYLRNNRSDDNHIDTTTYMIKPESVRFGTGEGKAVLHNSMRGKDVYIICDCYNYGETYKMYGQEFPLSPDDHFQDLKRIIGAIGGKARRITVVMPMLYEARQDKRSRKESLDCAMALQELVSIGVSNILTFDVHNNGIQNAIPLSGFDNVRPTFQMIKALLDTVDDIEIAPDKLMVVSPDEGGMSRCMYYSSVLGLDLGMFYKRRDYSRVENGKNPIVAHEYLGRELDGMDAIVVDDIISSGESMLDVARQLKKRGANRIFQFASFGLFCNGLEEFDKAYEEGVISKVFTTNAIYRSPELLKREWYCEVNLCKYVALLVDTLNKDKTISDLLNPVTRIENCLATYRAKKKEKETLADNK